MTEPATTRTITRTELLAARDTARTKILELAEEVFGPDSSLDRIRIHEKNSFADKISTLVNYFLALNEGRDNFDPKVLFDYMMPDIAPSSTQTDGTIHYKRGDQLRESLAAVEHLLDALGLKQQFIEYKRSLNPSLEIKP